MKHSPTCNVTDSKPETPSNPCTCYKQRVDQVNKAREAILEELKRRYKSGDKSVQPNKQWSSTDQNCFSGAGKMQCPICTTGMLFYRRSPYNGHVHASCTTKECVNWME